MDKIFMTLPNNPEYVSVARITASVLANQIGFDIEDIEDIKLAVGEACNNAVLHGNHSEKFDLTFYIYEDKIEIEVVDKGRGFNLDFYEKPTVEDYDGNGLGIFIMESLMDQVIIDSEVGDGTTIKLVKSL